MEVERSLPINYHLNNPRGYVSRCARAEVSVCAASSLGEEDGTLQLRAKMEKSDWIKVESKSTRPGTFYYFNKVTKKSSWKEPPELKVRTIQLSIKTC